MPVIKTKKADLKLKYGIYLKVSFIFSLLLLIAVFTFTPKLEHISIIEPEPPDTIKVTVIPTVQKEKPVLPKPPVPILAGIDDVLEDIILEDTDLNQNEIIKDTPPLLVRPNMENEEIPFTFSEVLPEPIGGIAAIQKKIKYTNIAIMAGIEGKVLIEVTIDKKGIPYDAIVLKGLGGGLDEEALNAVLKTKFKPGLQRDKPVLVRMVIPVKFELN